jgi:hypothetical protein
MWVYSNLEGTALVPPYKLYKLGTLIANIAQ